MGNGIVRSETRPWSMVPQNLDEAMKFAGLIADSDLAPPNYKGKPGNVLIAMQMAAEIGLSPIQGLQNIAVISNRPCLYGDALLAVCQVHPDFLWIKEEFDAQGSAVCTVKRKGYPEHTQVFSLKDMVQAGYDKKPGPWQTSRQRMLQLRARAFALRNTFSDALKGLSSAEEAMDTAEPVTVTVIEPSQSPTAKLKEKLKASEPEPAPPAIEPPPVVEEPPEPFVPDVTCGPDDPAPSVIDILKEEFPPPVEYISKNQALALNKKLVAAGKSYTELQDHFGIQLYSDLPLSRYEEAKAWCDAKN